MRFRCAHISRPFVTRAPYSSHTHPLSHLNLIRLLQYFKNTVPGSQLSNPSPCPSSRNSISLLPGSSHLAPVRDSCSLFVAHSPRKGRGKRQIADPRQKLSGMTTIKTEQFYYIMPGFSIKRPCRS